MIKLSYQLNLNPGDFYRITKQIFTTKASIKVSNKPTKETE